MANEHADWLLDFANDNIRKLASMDKTADRKLRNAAGEIELFERFKEWAKFVMTEDLYTWLNQSQSDNPRNREDAEKEVFDRFYQFYEDEKQGAHDGE